MNKQNAIHAINLLNRVEIKGHKERETMNVVCEDLLLIVNAEPPKEPNGETDPQ